MGSDDEAMDYLSCFDCGQQHNLPLPIEKTGDDFFVRFSDKSNDVRNQEQLEEMVERVRKVVNPYGFDILNYGSWQGAKKIVNGENLMVEMSPKKGNK